MLQLKWLIKTLAFILLFITVPVTYPLYADGNIWLTTNLRKDLSEVIYSRDYRLFINATALPGANLPMGTGTAGWLSVDLGNNAGFSQVGLVAYPDGLHWFAISFYPITCTPAVLLPYPLRLPIVFRVFIQKLIIVVALMFILIMVRRRAWLIFRRRHSGRLQKIGL